MTATAAQAECTYPSTAVCNGRACSGETRPAGTIIYNKDWDVIQRCGEDGSWQALEAIGAAPSDCSLDGQAVSHLASYTFYSAEDDESCASISQSRMCRDGALDGDPSYQYADCQTVDPCETGPIGTVCTSDGAVFAGLTVGNARMYVADADETANGGTYEYGGYGTDLNGDNASVAPELLDDGLANTNWLLANGTGDHEAAQVCRDRGPDWYLPAIEELGTLYANRAQLGAADLPTSTSRYRSSSEDSNYHARIQRFSDGNQNNYYGKYYAYLVRCVRR